MQRQFEMALENLEELGWKFLTKLLKKTKQRIVLNSGSKSWNLGYNVKM